MIRKKQKIVTKFEEDSRMLPFVQFTVDGKKDKYVALIDSGSEATLLDTKVSDSLRDSVNYRAYKTDNMVFDGLGGSVNETDGNLFSMLITIKTDKNEDWNIPVAGAIMDMTSMQEAFSRAIPDAHIAMIIGSDSLERMNAKIDYKKKEVVLYGILGDKEAEN